MTTTNDTHIASPLGGLQGAAILSRFLTQTHFESQEDFIRNLHFKIPERFNFAYDVMDVWAEEQPDKLALLWTNDEGACRRFSFGELKTLSDRTAAWFMQMGIGRGDKVMLILKRRCEFWLSMLALHKIGAIAIPATHMLTRHDIVYRNTRAGIKAIVCVGEEYVMRQVSEAMAESPTVETLVSVGPLRAEGFHDWQSEWEQAPAFVRPDHVNDNDDTMLMYFTSGTSGEQDGGPRLSLCPRSSDHGRVLAQPVRRQHTPNRGRHRLGKGRLGKDVRTVVCRGGGVRLRPREVHGRQDTPSD